MCRKKIRLSHFTSLSVSCRHLIVYMPGKLTREEFPTCLAAFYFLMPFASSSSYVTREHVGVQSTFIDMIHSYCAHCFCIQTTVNTFAVALHTRTSLRDCQVNGFCFAVCLYLCRETQMDSAVFIEIRFRRSTPHPTPPAVSRTYGDDHCCLLEYDHVCSLVAR
jgi:hypothetical protein